MVLKGKNDYGPAAEQNAIHLALCTDDNYVRHAMVVLASVRANTTAHLAAHLIVAEQTQLIAREAAAAAAKLNLNISVYAGDNGPFTHVRMTMLATHATYYRLMIGELIPQDRVIYLDCDVIVQDDVKALSEWDMGGALIAGVPDRVDGKIHNAYYGIDINEPYFNAGVLVIDAAAWRQTEFYRRACAFVAENGPRLRFHDQDVLHVLCAGRKCVLPARWNVPQRKFGHVPLASALPPIPQFRGIFHATGFQKPWLKWADPWAQRLYLTYAERLGYGLDPREPSTPAEHTALKRVQALGNRPLPRPVLVNRLERDTR